MIKPKALPSGTSPARGTTLVTVFGGSGFVGRYVVAELLKTGVRVRLAERDPKNAWFLKPLGGLGQTQFAAADVTRPDTVRRAVAGADAVINLVGVLAGDFERIHVDGARHVAEAAAEAGAGAMAQMSAIGADPDSGSRYGRSKGAGERAVREAFPAATILRPSIVFGREDDFINRFAAMIRLLPVVPVVAPAATFQPVFAGDVGRATALSLVQPSEHGGRTYELGGPQVLTMRQLFEWIARATGRERLFLDVPNPAARLMAAVPGTPITTDQWRMLQRPNIVTEGAEGLAAFGIAPAALDTIAEGWLTRYRRHGRFAAHPSV